MRGLVRGNAVPCSFRFVTGEESCGLLSGSGAEIGPNCVRSALLPPWDRELQYTVQWWRGVIQSTHSAFCTKGLLFE